LLFCFFDAFLSFPALLTTNYAEFPAPANRSTYGGACEIGGGRDTGGGGYLITGGEIGLESSSSLSSKAIYFVFTDFFAIIGFAKKASLLKPEEFYC
jgi:hypothetical protein